MNCDTCSEKFTRLKDLIRHASSIRLIYQCSHFFCIPCSLPLYNLSSVVEHIGSEEHSIMALATGIHFDGQDENSESLDDSFPPIYCCLLCGCRDGNSYQQHIKNSTHSKLALLMRAIICSKEVHCSDKNTDKKTQEFINKLINSRRKKFVRCSDDSEELNDSFDCHLCNIYFNNSECLKQHLEDQSHKRVEQFMIKLSNTIKEVDTVDSKQKFKGTFSKSLPPLYYCELCFLWIETTAKYVRHAKSVNHTRIQELYSKLSNKRNGEVITLRGVGSSRDSHFYRSKEYCKLCTVWGATGYSRHLKDAGHMRIEHFLDSLSNEDKKFLEVYMETQADLKVGKSTPPNYCVLCNILYSNPEEYELHLEGAEHEHVKKHVPRDNFLGEKASKVLKTSSSSLHQHCNLQRANETNDGSPSVCFEDGETNGSSENSDNNSVPQEHYCELCEYLCYKGMDYDKHLNGDQHKRMRRLLSKRGKKKTCVDAHRSSSKCHPLQYRCELCEVFNPSREKYDKHLNSALHKRNHWLLYVLKQRPL